MAKDRINVNIAHLSLPLEVTDPDAMHSVGVSHLREYLDIMYGKPMPEGRTEIRLARSLQDALTSLSTDENLLKIYETNVLAYIPYWTRLTRPVIKSAGDAGKYIEGKFMEFNDPRQPAQIDNDFTYMLGMYDLSSFAIAAHLELPHPRLENEALVERAEGVVPPGQQYVRNQPGPNSGLEILLTQPILKYSDRQELRRIIDAGKILIDKSEEYVAVLTALTADLNPDT
jgi:hypothetical protein